MMMCVWLVSNRHHDEVYHYTSHFSSTLISSTLISSSIWNLKHTKIFSLLMITSDTFHFYSMGCQSVEISWVHKKWSKVTQTWHSCWSWLMWDENGGCVAFWISGDGIFLSSILFCFIIFTETWGVNYWLEAGIVSFNLVDRGWKNWFLLFLFWMSRKEMSRDDYEKREGKGWKRDDDEDDCCWWSWRDVMWEEEMK